MFTYDVHMCVPGVIPIMLNPKLIPMVMVVQGLNCEDGVKSSCQRKEYLTTVFCISQPRQIELAGHIYMHDTTASEGAHRLFVKKVMARVRKGTDYDTSSPSIDWVFRTRTWAKIIDEVKSYMIRYI